MFVLFFVFNLFKNIFPIPTHEKVLDDIIFLVNLSVPQQILSSFMLVHLSNLKMSKPFSLFMREYWMNSFFKKIKVFFHE